MGNNIVPFNDPFIFDNDILYRRIPPWQINPTKNRPNSDAFGSVELSVDVAQLTTPQITMAPVSDQPDFNNWLLASFPAGVPRALSQLVYMKPCPDNPAHAIVWGKKRLSIRRKIARACEWIEWQNPID